jgi:hypothetical protein
MNKLSTVRTYRCIAELGKSKSTNVASKMTVTTVFSQPAIHSTIIRLLSRFASARRQG